MDSRISKRQLQGSKLIELRHSLYHWKAFGTKSLKWVYMTHLNTWNTSYGQKKGRESNCQFDSWPLKVNNHPNFFMCKWCATYRWKALKEDYNFVLNLISIKGSQTKLWAPKIMGIPTLGILGFSLGSHGTKCQLDASPMAIHRVYYKEKVVASPKFRLRWIFWVRICLWLVITIKMF
jgi:hypothetical protein